MVTDSFRLDGKIALVTGATGQIGAATVRLMHARGAQVIAVDRPGSDFADLPTLANLEADVTDEHQVRDYVALAGEASGGRIHVFFNNAGVEGPVKPIPDYSLKDFRHVFAVNVEGVFLGMKYVLPIMLEQGAGVVINTSSVAGLSGAPGMAGYNASKHAVVGLTRVAAKEVAGKGVRVVCVNPGPIEGRMMASLDDGANTAMEQRAQFIPAKRYGTPEEVAAVVAFLASEAAAYVNGAIHAIDGALTA